MIIQLVDVNAKIKLFADLHNISIGKHVDVVVLKNAVQEELRSIL